MVVLLLLLLNNEDLAMLKTFLESTYKLKGDRRDVELLILKVVPLESINPRIFLDAIIEAIDGSAMPHPFSGKSTDQINKGMSGWWDQFVQLRVREGYFLPGWTLNLGRESLSWSPKWSGYCRSSEVFKDLQYAKKDCDLRAINEIPALDLHPETSYSEVAVELSDRSIVNVSSKDIEQIELLVPNIYVVKDCTEVNPKHRNLRVEERVINEDLCKAIKLMDNLIDRYNSDLQDKPGRPSMIAKFLNQKQPSQFMHRLGGSTPITMNDAFIDSTFLASCFKKGGRRISRFEVENAILDDLRRLWQAKEEMKRRAGDLGLSFSSNQNSPYKQLTSVDTLFSNAFQTSQRLPDGAERQPSPIIRIMYPGKLDVRESLPWFDYEAWLTNDSGFTVLQVQAKRAKVDSVRWQKRQTLAQVFLHGHPTAYWVTPPCPESEVLEEDEVMKDDLVLLLGQYMVIATPTGDPTTPSSLSCLMDNCLRIVSIETEVQSRRGANRRFGQSGLANTTFM